MFDVSTSGSATALSFNDLPAAAPVPELAPTEPKLARKFQPLRDAKILIDVMKAAIDRDRPLITHLVITRRCNLSCGYCFEYDKVSEPVPLATLKARIDHLARLKSVFVTLTGGESLLHPDVVELVRYVREQNMTPFLN